MLQPGDGAIFTTLSFRCNGTLKSLTIPSEIRQQVHPVVDDLLEPRPSIWRFDGDRYRRIIESTARQSTIDAPGTTDSDDTIRLHPGVVLSFNFTVMLQVDIQAGDMLGFQLTAMSDNRIEHLPLLYKPGPTPGSFTPVIIANFNTSSEPATSGPVEGEPLYIGTVSCLS